MRTGTVTGAARDLGLSQPAVSKLLHHTEDQLGVRLFYRHRGRLTPTAEAREIYPAITPLFRNGDGVKKHVADLCQTRTGYLRIATIPTLGAELLPASIAAFLTGREQVTIGLKVINARQVVDRVVNRQVELGIVYAPVDHQAIEAHEVCPAEAVCVLPRGHALAKLPVVRPEDLRGYPLITMGYGTPIGQLIDDVFKQCGVERRPVVQTSYALIAYGWWRPAPAWPSSIPSSCTLRTSATSWSSRSGLSCGSIRRSFTCGFSPFLHYRQRSSLICERRPPTPSFHRMCQWKRSIEHVGNVAEWPVPCFRRWPRSIPSVHQFPLICIQFALFHLFNGNRAADQAGFE